MDTLKKLEELRDFYIDRDPKLEHVGQFTGTCHYYRHSLLKGLLLTDGAMHLSMNGAGWLVDAVASYQIYPDIRKGQPFQCWKLNKIPDTDGAWLSGDDGNGNIFAKQKIEYTDFPLETITLFLSDDGDGHQVMMLTSEY